MTAVYVTNTHFCPISVNYPHILPLRKSLFASTAVQITLIEKLALILVCCKDFSFPLSVPLH